MKPAFISERLSMLLLAISTIAMIVLAVLFAFAPDLRSDENYDTNALSRSAVGFSGLVRYLSLAGIPVAVDRGPMGRGIAAPSLIILTPNANTTAADIAGYEHRAPLLITPPAVEGNWALPYVGADYTLRATWLPGEQLPSLRGQEGGMQPLWANALRPWLRWLIYRDARPPALPPVPEQVVLWAAE